MRYFAIWLMMERIYHGLQISSPGPVAAVLRCSLAACVFCLFPPPSVRGVDASMPREERLRVPGADAHLTDDYAHRLDCAPGERRRKLEFAFPR